MACESYYLENLNGDQMYIGESDFMLEEDWKIVEYFHGTTWFLDNIEIEESVGNNFFKTVHENWETGAYGKKGSDEAFEVFQKQICRLTYKNLGRKIDQTTLDSLIDQKDEFVDWLGEKFYNKFLDFHKKSLNQVVWSDSGDYKELD